MKNNNDPKPTEKIPTESEINIYDSLDERCAVRNFLGKDLAQAEGLFREDFLNYCEGLLWMGPVAFRFYLSAAITYLVSPQSDNDADAANCFYSLIHHTMDCCPEKIAPLKGQIRAAVAAVLADFARFDCDPEIYIDLEPRYCTLLARLEE